MKINLEAIPGPEVQIGDTSYLYFGGTSYLGMQTDLRFREELAGFTVKLGTHWGASRAGNLVLSVYDKTEASLARWVGSESCLTLSSGFMAARILVEHFTTPGYSCLFSPNCHEALLPAGGQRARDWSELYSEVGKELQKDRTPVVFTDTVGGEETPGPILQRLEALPGKCILVADDSHGIGVCGSRGRGSWNALQKFNFKDLLVCSSLGKALAITAGMVAGPARILNQLRETPFFEGASPAPPAGVAALGVGLSEGWYEQQYKRLLQNTRYFYKRTNHLQLLKSQPPYPVFYFTNPKLAQYLRENRILITDFEYAAEAGSSSPKRIVITAAHRKEHLEKLAKVLEQF
jgi:7-keto-8-aminopelargonate synthetase-like enzyme